MTTPPKIPVLIAALTLGATSLVFAQTPAPDEETILLSPFEVTTSSDNYTSAMTTTGTRVASSIKELPFTVDVVTAEFFNDFAAFEPGEQFALVSSYTQLDGEGTYRLRGSSAAGLLRNGFFRGGLIDKVNVERAEVIKGPAAAIYGRAAPGGVVNIVTKVPKPTPQASFSAWAGGDALFRTEASTTGPVLPGKLLYRIDAAHTQYDGSYDMTGNKTNALSGALLYKFAPQTSLTLELETLERYDYGQSAATPWLIESSKYIRPMYELGSFSTQADGAYHRRAITSFNLTFEHRFDRTLSLRVGAFASKRDLEVLNMGGANFRPTDRTIYNREPSWRFNPEKSGGVQSDLLKELTLGKTSHRLLLTLDFLRDRNGADVIQRLPSASLTNAAYNIRNLSVDHPNYYIDRTLSDYTRYARDRGSDVKIFGTFVSDRITMFDGKLVALIGGRYDWVETYLWDDLAIRTATGGRVESRARVRQPTYQSGLNYSPIPAVTFYVSGSTSFRNQTSSANTQGQNGEPFPAEKGEGIEGGVKTSFFHERIGFSAAVFDQKRTNVIRTDPDDSTRFSFSGEERVRGVESSLNASLTTALVLFANYSYLDSEVVNGDAYLVGRPTPSTPRHQIGSGARYRFRDGRLKGLTLNASWRYFGAVFPYDSNDARLYYAQPSYKIVDFGAAYTFKTGRFAHTIGFNIKNLLDEEYYVGAGRLAPNFQALARYSLSFR